MAYVNLSLFIFLILEWYYFKFHSLICQIGIFNHILIQTFLQLVAGLDKGRFFFFFGFRFHLHILVSVGGMVKSPKLISSTPGRGFLGGL